MGGDMTLGSPRRSGAGETGGAESLGVGKTWVMGWKGAGGDLEGSALRKQEGWGPICAVAVRVVSAAARCHKRGYLV
jgi:hypothetical protein